MLFCPIHTKTSSVRPATPRPAQQAPPRSANTKCKVAPPSRLYSDAILSSALAHKDVSSYHHQHTTTNTPPKPNQTKPNQTKPNQTTPYTQNEDRKRREFLTHICFPPKINRCCTGGMPSFSSTRSLMRETCLRAKRRGTSVSERSEVAVMGGVGGDDGVVLGCVALGYM